MREHHNAVKTIGGPTSLRMLAAGRVDYAYMNLSIGMRQIALMGLSGTVEPLLSGYVVEEGYYVLQQRARFNPLVNAFSDGWAIQTNRSIQGDLPKILSLGSRYKYGDGRQLVFAVATQFTTVALKSLSVMR